MATGYKQMLADADTIVASLDRREIAAKLGSDDLVFVDIRDPRELERAHTDTMAHFDANARCDEAAELPTRFVTPSKGLPVQPPAVDAMVHPYEETRLTSHHVNPHHVECFRLQVKIQSVASIRKFAANVVAVPTRSHKDWRVENVVIWGNRSRFNETLGRCPIDEQVICRRTAIIQDEVRQRLAA